MLKFILGRAGCGKTEEIYKKLCEATGKAMLIVPDQFVFEAERIIAEKTDEKTENITITGFSALSENILRKFSNRKTYADDTAKHIIMLETVKTLKGSFKYFSTAANKKGFAGFSLKAIEELKRAGISPDMLKTASTNLSKTLKEKVDELTLIYGLYNENLAKIYDDRDDNLALCAEISAENNCFAGCTVFIDGFDSFSGSQLSFLTPIIAQSTDCYIALRLDRDIKNELNQATTEDTLTKLEKIAKKENCDTEYTELSDSKTRYKKDSLLKLRNYLVDGKTTEAVTEDVKDSVICKMSRSKDAETDYVFATIKKLTKLGYRYSDINILCPTPLGYINNITSSAMRYDVPLFADIPSPISRKPLIKYLIAVLTAAQNPDGNNVMRLIKSGFARTREADGKTRPITLEDINKLQTYCDTWDISHMKFDKPFSHIETKEEKRLDDIRENIVAPLVKLGKACENKTGAEITELFTDYLFSCADIRASIQGKCQIRTTRELAYDKTLTDEYNQLWGVVCEMLETMVTTMEDIPCTLAEYTNILSSCAELISLSKPPQVMDSVMFGDIRRTRSKGAKVVFITGADENSFPDCNCENDGVFTLQEYSELAGNKIDLSCDGEKQYTAELFACCNALTLPSEKLYITYTGNKDQMGEYMQIVTDLFGIKITENDISQLPPVFFCESIRSAEKQLALHFDDEAKAKEIKTALEASGDSAYTDLIDNAQQRLSVNANIHNVDRDRAELIFGFDALSPTAIKSLNSCRFEYFCKYGLGIRAPSTKKLNPQNVGNIIHFVMDYCISRFYTGAKENPAIPDERIKADIKDALALYRKQQLMEEQHHTPRFNALFSNLADLCFHLLKYMTKELANSKFKPSYFELSLEKPDEDKKNGFKYEPLEIDVNVNGKTEKISLYGVVDRVDIADISSDEKREKHIRVIDYKTGAEEFKLQKVYYGLNLQLLIYLFALSESNPEYIPSAASYFPAGVISVQKDLANPSEDELRDTWMKTHGEPGIVIKDTQSDTERVNYISRTPNGKGEYTDFFKATTLTEKKLEKMKKHIIGIISDNVGCVKQGDVTATAFKDKEIEISCRYCAYKAVCGAGKEHTTEINNNDSEQFIADLTEEKEGDNNDNQ